MSKTKLTTKPLEIQPALLTVPQVCQYLNISTAMFYKIKTTGAFGPLPVKLGTCRKVLYSRAELDTYVKSGCPHRKKWQEERKQNSF